MVEVFTMFLYHVFIDFKKAFDRFGMQLSGQP